MEQVIQVLEYRPSLTFQQGANQLIKPAAPKIWIPLESALLIYLGEQVKAGEFTKDDAIYNQAYRRIMENTDLLIYWICKSNYESWKHLMSVPDCRVLPEEQLRWEHGWADPENWNVEQYSYIHADNFITHDRKIVKPVGKIRAGESSSVFCIPTPHDPDGIYNLVMAYATGDGTHFVNLSENYINMPMLQPLPDGGYRPGAEAAQVIIAVRYHVAQLNAVNPNHHYQQMLSACDDFLLAANNLAYDRAAANL